MSAGRRVRAYTRATFSLLLMMVLLVYLLRSAGVSLLMAVVVGAAFPACVIVVVLPIIVSSWGGYFPGARNRRVTPVTEAVWAATGAAVVLTLWPGLSVPVAAVVGTLALPALHLYYRRDLTKSVSEQMRNLTGLRDLAEADDMAAACRAQLSDRRVVGTQRANVTVNLAHALAARSSLAGKPDGLVRPTGCGTGSTTWRGWPGAT